MGFGAWGILALRGPVLVLGVTGVAHFSVSQVVQFSKSVDTMPSFTPSTAPGGVPTVSSLNEVEAVRTFSAVIERCVDTGLLVGYVPGFPGAHSQAETLEELQVNLQEVITMLLEDGEPAMESDFVGLQQIVLPA